MSSLRRSLKRPPILPSYVVIAAIGAVIAGIASTYYREDAQATPQAMANAPAIPVSTKVITPQTTRVWSDFSGRLVAVDSAAIRPEVSGRITQLRFRDGQIVKAGDILCVIDPRSYEAAVAKAKAAVATAQSNAKFAKTELGRASDLIRAQAIAARAYDERVTANNVANAAILSAEAELKQANLDLEHAYVKAPISGRVSRAEVTVGNLVQAGPNSPVITSIVASEAVYADFEIDEKTYLQAVRSHTQDGKPEHAVPVELTLRGDSDHRYKGTIHAFDNQIDGASGTIRARAKFINKDGSLVPGMFASIRMSGAGESEALLVPDRAIGTDQNKKFIYVVGEGNKVMYREVVLGASINGQRIVTSGLEPGERVIVDGVQHVRPDAIVEPKDVEDEPRASQLEQPQTVATNR